ncbi:complement C2-like [Pseudophryne corroboree]|uniref:complement C2-like n=1 Tax=Pseudophryne corroboree TaxID=495146 RepID=UPI003082057B
MPQAAMGHRLGTQCRKSRGFLRITLLLVPIFAVAGDSAVTCPPDAGFPNGLTHLTNGLNVGSTAKFLCPSGEYPWPASSRTCQANGQWSAMRSNTWRKVTRISCKKMRCPDPLVFENGGFHPRGPYLVGTNITFMCNDGYIPRGSMKRTCKINGKWSGETAVCDDGAGHCPDPGTPPGAVKTGVRYDVDESISYRCASGLSLMGSAKRSCLESRRWSGTEVSCQYPYSFDLPEEVGEHFAGSLSGILTTKEKKDSLSIGRTIKIEKDGILNVYILIDASHSVGEDNFKIAKDCTKEFVQKLGEFDMKIEFGILSYASEPRSIIRIHGDLSDDPDEVLELIENNLDYSKHKDKSGTNIYAALKDVLDMMSFQEQKYRNKTEWRSVRHVVVLLTDGKANMGGRPVDMIKRIKGFLDIKQGREDYLDVYAFGIGNDIDKTELSEIASQKDKEKHVFILEDTEKMKTVFQEITKIKNYGEMCGLNVETSESEKSERHPWNVLVASKSTNPCFASLISSSWVLSAAHCFQAGQPPNVYSFEIGGKIYHGKQVEIHDCYQLRRKVNIGVKVDYDYDVALVKLAEKVTFSNKARPICIPCTEPANRAMKKGAGTTCNDHRQRLLGNQDDIPAGFLSKNQDDPKELEESHVTIKSNHARDECTRALQKWDQFKNISIKDMVSPRHLCVEGDMSCKGESGGSLFVDLRERQRFFQVGILSFGLYNPCKTRGQRKPNNNARDFYVNIMEVLPWLRKHLAGELDFLPGIPDQAEIVCPT